MSLREKAREVKAVGEAKRGNYDPEGAPLRLYKRWADDRLARGKDVPERENFCHYWRVVGVWAPMVSVRRALLSDTAMYAYMGLVAAAVILAVITGAVLKPVIYLYLLFAVAFVYAIFGLIGGLATGTDKRAMDSSDREFFKWFPHAWIGYGVGRLMNKVPQKVWLGLGGTLIAAMLVGITVAGFQDIGFWVFACVLGVPVGILGIIFAAITLEDYINGSRANSREKKSEVTYDKAGNVVVEPRKKGLIKRILTNVADFLVLIAQVVRVNKWKICPIVNIDTTPTEAVE